MNSLQVAIDSYSELFNNFINFKWTNGIGPAATAADNDAGDDNNQSSRRTREYIERRFDFESLNWGKKNRLMQFRRRCRSKQINLNTHGMWGV